MSDNEMEYVLNELREFAAYAARENRKHWDALGLPASGDHDPEYHVKEMSRDPDYFHRYVEAVEGRGFLMAAVLAYKSVRDRQIPGEGGPA